MKKRKIEETILKKIRDKEITIKPRWKFVAREKTIQVAWLIMLLVCATGFLILWSFIEFYNIGELWQYGEVGRSLIVEDIPYLWLIVISLMVFGSWIVIRQIGENYKKNKWLLAGKIAILIILLMWLMKIWGVNINY